MKINKRTVCSVFLGFPLFLAACAEFRNKADDRRDHSLADDLAWVAARHGLRQEELVSRVARLALEGKSVPKGGVGLVKSEVYVKTQGRTNELMIDSQWKEYGPATEPQLIVLGRKTILSRTPIPPESTQDIVLMLYTPQFIKFIDWGRASGGVYDRQLDE